MTRSSFEKKPELAKDLAKATMWTLDGRTFDAPGFRFGMDPCGAMYSTVLDLSRFMSVLFARGRTPEGRQLLKPETLEAMWTPQFAEAGAKRGFGLGFALSDLDGHRWVGHDGAVYGFATTLMALPDDKLGVVIVTTKDSTNAVIDAIAIPALKLALAKRADKPLPPKAPTPEPLTRAEARLLEGRYAKGERTLDLTESGGRLRLTRSDDDGTLSLKRLGDGLVSDDALRPRSHPQGRRTDGHPRGRRLHARRGARACRPARQVEGPGGRVRVGPQHALHPRRRRQAARAHRVVHLVPAAGGRPRPATASRRGASTTTRP